MKLNSFIKQCVTATEKDISRLNQSEDLLRFESEKDQFVFAKNTTGLYVNIAKLVKQISTAKDFKSSNSAQAQLVALIKDAFLTHYPSTRSTEETNKLSRQLGDATLEALHLPTSNNPFRLYGQQRAHSVTATDSTSMASTASSRSL
ncbi:MAG: hypothetical protein P1U63_04775 [Coxiellaceae bacterium]|nr:hypothetical protein [Coxiellaceae bacterium]